MASLRDRVKTTNSAQVAPEQATQFIEAAAEADPQQGKRPWEDFDKKAVPRTTFNLRLNDYELALLRWLADQQGDSMQKIAKRALIPILEKMATEDTDQ